MSLAPQERITEEERAAGLHRLMIEAAYSGATTALTSGVILVAFALHLGASNIVVGLLASAPFLCQLLQLPAILLVERWRARKRIAVLTSIAGRLMLLVMALAAFAPREIAIPAVIVAQFILCSFGAIGTCAWNAWVRDLVPEARLGAVFGRRTAYAAAVSLAGGLSAAIILDRSAEGSDARATAFAALYLVGCVTGLLSAVIVARIPEPAMETPASSRANLIALIRAPLADLNFRRLLGFLCSWQFAINLATPFITVFIVRRLGFDMTFVMILSVLSQIANILALSNWSRLSDRFANKSVLLVAAPIYILCIVGLIVASQFSSATIAQIYLAVLHLVMGAAVAGVTLATTNIALKLSPRGSATAYVAASALATAVAAGSAPVIGGAFADFFAARQLELLLRWTSPAGAVQFAPLSVEHWDFYFLLAGLLGLYALHRLGLVREAGEIEGREMLQQFLHQTRRSARNLSTVAGLRALTDLPGNLAREARIRRKPSRIGPTDFREENER